jgi:hypothetical protein
MTTLVSATSDKPGMLVTVSPAVMIGSSIGLFVLGTILLLVAYKLHKKDSSHALLVLATFFGWTFGACGVLGVLYGILGPNLFS